MFKNAQISAIVGDASLSAIDMEVALGRAVFRPLGLLDAKITGFVNPLDMSDVTSLTYLANRCVFFTLRTDEKVLPKTAIDEKLQARIDAIKHGEGRKVGKKERKDLRELVIEELLPGALPKQKLLRGYVDLDRRVFVIDTTSSNRNNELLAFIRSNLFLGGIELGTTCIKVVTPPTLIMTTWLQEDSCPSPFTIDDEGELLAPGKDGSLIRISRQDMASSDIRHLLSIGRNVTKLGVTWNDRISLVVHNNMTMAKLRWTDTCHQRIADLGQSENAEEHREATATIMTGDIRELLRDLTDAFGGMDNSEALAQSSNTREDDDPLLPEAIHVVTRGGRPSISHVQGELRIGYNRAARLIDVMEERGIVSAMDASGARSLTRYGASLAR